MSKSHRYSLRLNNRDRLLFEYLFVTKGATRRQVHKDIFTGRSAPTVHDRLSKLEKYGYIERFPVHFDGSMLGYRLTYKTVNDCEFFDIQPKRSEFKSTNPSHDFSLIEIRRGFLRAEGLKHYLMENELQSGLINGKVYEYNDFKSLNSDAFIRLRIGSNEFSGAIEFEQSVKMKSRYIELFNSYYDSDHVTFVLYVVANNRLYSAILNFEKEVRGEQRPKIFAITYNDFKNEDKCLEFKNHDGHVLNITLKQDGGVK